MKYLAVIFRKCAWQTVMWDFPHWQYEVHCAADHLWHICSGTVDVAFFIVCIFQCGSCFHATKRLHSPFAKKDRYSVKRRLADAIISFCLILTHYQRLNECIQLSSNCLSSSWMFASLFSRCACIMITRPIWGFWIWYENLSSTPSNNIIVSTKRVFPLSNS